MKTLPIVILLIILYPFSNPVVSKFDYFSEVKPDINKQTSYIAHLEGYITSERDHSPVQNARISITPLEEIIYSDSNGYFSLENIVINEKILPITVMIEAEGFGTWTLRDARLLANDTLIITAVLSDSDYTDIVPAPRANNPLETYPIQDVITLSSTNLINDLSVDQPIPQNIRVRVAGYPYHCDTDRDYEIKIVNFKQYVKNVLPNEWSYLWLSDSLRAGAMAAKLYAWYWIALDGKWNDADVWDSTCDQVYNPNFEYQSTNSAVEFTWNWVLSRDDKLIHTSYRRDLDLCLDAHLEGNCMGQLESQDMAEDGYSWDQILKFFYHDTDLSVAIPPFDGGYAFRFNGSPGDTAENRVLIPVNYPDKEDPSPPADIGAEDFTVEWWMKSNPVDNTAPAIICGKFDNWIYGNIIFDRDRAGLPGGFGFSIADNKLVFGINGNNGENLTLCGKSKILDNEWHHVAMQRRRADGYLWIYLDGRLEASANGPDGDVSYPENAPPSEDNDHYIGIGAWKLDNEYNLHPFFRGWIDELRLSNFIRYSKNFIPSTRPFTSDSYTVALYHFDDGIGSLVSDSSTVYGGPSHGFRQYGGAIEGPEWVISDLFINNSVYLPVIMK